MAFLGIWPNFHGLQLSWYFGQYPEINGIKQIRNQNNILSKMDTKKVSILDLKKRYFFGPNILVLVNATLDQYGIAMRSQELL